MHATWRMCVMRHTRNERALEVEIKIADAAGATVSNTDSTEYAEVSGENGCVRISHDALVSYLQAQGFFVEDMS